MDEQAFLDAIIAAPDDDAPRLIYADWLDEHGHAERAEFIRLQSELARKERYDPSRLPLENREQEILKKHGAKWAEPIAAITGDYEYRRGFVDAVSIGARKFLTHGARLFQLAPVRNVRLVRLASSNIRATDFAKSDLLPRIRGLVVQGQLDAAVLCALLTSPGLKKLTGLTLEGYLTAEAIEPVLSGCLPKLESLNLDAEGSILNTEHVEKLADARWASSLRHLNLNGHVIKVGGAEAIAHSKRLKGLLSLSLKRCGVGLAGTQAIADSKNLPNLRTLDLRSNRLTDNAARALAASKGLPALRELFLGMNDFGPDAARALADWPGLARLRLLHFFACRIGDEGAIALAESPHIANLWCLDVTLTDIGKRGERALAESPNLKNVRIGSFKGD
jgi:uncharacterized protein (TIGR02996 family)